MTSKKLWRAIAPSFGCFFDVFVDALVDRLEFDVTSLSHWLFACWYCETCKKLLGAVGASLTPWPFSRPRAASAPDSLRNQVAKEQFSADSFQLFLSFILSPLSFIYPPLSPQLVWSNTHVLLAQRGGNAVTKSHFFG
jgi:hypothetical protein